MTELGAELSAIDRIEAGRWRVKDTATHHIEIAEKLTGYRIVETPKAFPLVCDRGWCYPGKELGSFLAVCLAAIAWDGSADSEPEGFYKRAGE